jgi:capsular exopolysaccharide synthesis family protein
MIKVSTVNLVEFNEPRSMEAEVYRALRTKIKFLSYQKGIKTIAVTSSKSGEGKTTVCANLGVSMAQSGSKVLMVDGNLRNPTLHKIFMLANTRGVTNILSKGVPFRDVISSSGIKDLDIILCGPKPPNPSDILNFERVKSLFDEMKRDYDYVFVDTGPIIEMTDNLLLTSSCDCTILVIVLDGTRKEYASKAKELLVNVNADILGIVLNKAGSISRNGHTEGSRRGNVIKSPNGRGVG